MKLNAAQRLTDSKLGYHGTLSSLLSSIKRKGIVGNGSVTYLARTKEQAYKWAYSKYGFSGKPVSLAVISVKLDKKPTSDVIQLSRNIRPDEIEAVDKYPVGLTLDDLTTASKITAHKEDEEWVPGIRGYHYAVGCLLLAADTLNFSFQLRSPNSDTGNCYGCWGGSIDGNEEAFTALKRELKEETGYDGPMKIYPLMTYYDQSRGFHYYNNLVVVPQQFQINPALEFRDESSGDVWVPYQEWPDPLHPGLQSLLKDQPSMFTVEQAMKIIGRAKSQGTDPMRTVVSKQIVANL